MYQMATWLTPFLHTPLELFLLVPLWYPAQGFFFSLLSSYLPNSILNLPYFCKYAILSLYVNISLHSKRANHLHLSFLSYTTVLHFNTEWYLHVLQRYKKQSPSSERYTGLQLAQSIQTFVPLLYISLFFSLVCFMTVSNNISYYHFKTGRKR